MGLASTVGSAQTLGLRIVSSLNPLDENQVRAYREEVLLALRELSRGLVPFLVGVRRVLALANVARERDRDLDLLVVIDSETDHLPKESAKKYCSEAWLRKCEEEEKQVEHFYRAEVVALCDRLIARFSGTV